MCWNARPADQLRGLNCCKTSSDLNCFDSFCLGFMHLYRWWWLCLFNVSAIDTCSTWLRMCGLRRLARAQCFPVKWNRASATAPSDTVDGGGNWINAPKLESAGPTLRLERANVSPLTAVSWEAINDSPSHNPGSDPRITLIASAPWPAKQERRGCVCLPLLLLMSLNSQE